MKKKMLKLASLAMAAVMTLSLAACGGGSSSGGSDSGNGGEAGAEGWEWERKVTIVCPWGVGGGADGTLRPLQTVLEDELGVPVEIVNVEGAGGTLAPITQKNSGMYQHPRAVSIAAKQATCLAFSSSFIQTILSASEFHRIIPCGSWAVPPVGNCTLP